MFSVKNKKRKIIKYESSIRRVKTGSFAKKSLKVILIIHNVLLTFRIIIFL